MCAGRCRFIILNDFSFFITHYVSFVSIVSLVSFLSLGCVYILVRLFLFTLGFRCLSGSFDDFILFRCIPLPWCFLESGIHQFSLTTLQTAILHLSKEKFKQLFCTFLSQAFSELPYGAGIRYVICLANTYKTLKTQSITELKLHFLITQIIESLQYQYLKHLRYIVMRSSFAAEMAQLFELTSKEMNLCNLSNPWRTVVLLRNRNKSGICKDGGNSSFGTMRLLYHAEVSLKIPKYVYTRLFRSSLLINFSNIPPHQKHQIFSYKS